MSHLSELDIVTFESVMNHDTRMFPKDLNNSKLVDEKKSVSNFGVIGILAHRLWVPTLDLPVLQDVLIFWTVVVIIISIKNSLTLATNLHTQMQKKNYNATSCPEHCNKKKFFALF